jgi:hypothetical protein
VEAYDEWRLIFEVGNKDVGRVVDEAASRVPNDVDVHTRGDQILVYALSKEATRTAETILSELLTQIGVAPIATLTRWNPGAERWQDPSLPVEPPKRDIGPAWAALGELAWEVRVRSQSRSEARSLAEEALQAGHPTITGRGNRVTVGVATQEDAASLADELRLRVPTAQIATRPLSRWRRWLIRQRLLGNYAAGGDGGAGDFGGGGGNGGA